MLTLKEQQYLENKSLKKIINVYQLNYVNGKSPGFGDFLRGCFCMMQISKLLNIEFDIDMSKHPISKYIETDNINYNINYNLIEFYKDINDMRINDYKKIFLDKFIKYLIDKNMEIVPVFCNSFPIFNYQTEDGRSFIKSKLKPNKMMNNYIDITLKEINLKKYNYSIIHIRTGDKYLVNKDTITLKFVNRIKNYIIKNTDKNIKYLLLSDNNTLKQHLSDIPNIYMYIKEIQHVGGESMKNVDNGGIMNTMLDFYLMSYSYSIICLSVYCWKSGFSEWCGKIYNIPYVSHIISDDK